MGDVDWDDEFGLTMDPCEHPSVNGGVCAACGAKIPMPPDPTPAPTPDLREVVGQAIHGPDWDGLDDVYMVEDILAALAPHVVDRAEHVRALAAADAELRANIETLVRKRHDVAAKYDAMGVVAKRLRNGEWKPDVKRGVWVDAKGWDDHRYDDEPFESPLVASIVGEMEGE